MRRYLLLVLVLISIISVLSFSISVYTSEGNKVLPVDKILEFDGEKFKFILSVAEIEVELDVSKVVKISFDEKTKDGKGLILKNGLNIPYAVLIGISEGNAIFSLPYGGLKVYPLDKIAFINMREFTTLDVPAKKPLWVRTVSGAYFMADLVKIENGVFTFSYPYGELKVPEGDIVEFSVEPNPEGKKWDPGIYLPEMRISGKIVSFHDHRYVISTDFGELRVLEGSILRWVNPNPRSAGKIKSSILLKNLHSVTGQVQKWENGVVNFVTPWGKLVIPETDVKQVVMEEPFGVLIETTPSGATVKVDGKTVGKTPTLVRIFKAGLHWITITKPGYHTISRQFYLTPFTMTKLNFKLGYGNVWKRVADMPTPRDCLAAVALNGKIYAIGGNGGRNVVEVYDPDTNQWKRVADMPTPRDCLAAVALNGKIYAIGGHGGNKVVEVYDPETNQWKRVANIPTGRWGLAAVALNGKIYAIGGDGGMNVVEVYDPDTNQWKRVADMPTGRWGLAAVALNGKIYAIGGSGGGNVVEVYDPDTNQWKRVADMPTPRYKLAAVAFGGKIYAIGGYDGSNQLSAVEVYDPETNQWKRVAGMPTPRSYLAAVALNGKIYAIGGDGGMNVVEVYLPGEPGEVKKEVEKEKVKKIKEVEKEKVEKTEKVEKKETEVKPAKVNVTLIVIPPVTLGFFIGEKHDLEVEITGLGGFKKELKYADADSGFPVTFEDIELVPGHYTLKAKWGKHTCTWDMNVGYETLELRFMMGPHCEKKK